MANYIRQQTTTKTGGRGGDWKHAHIFCAGKHGLILEYDMWSILFGVPHLQTYESLPGNAIYIIDHAMQDHQRCAQACSYHTVDQHGSRAPNNTVSIGTPRREILLVQNPMKNLLF